jgi:hypothetical protein
VEKVLLRISGQENEERCAVEFPAALRITRCEMEAGTILSGSLHNWSARFPILVHNLHTGEGRMNFTKFLAIKKQVRKWQFRKNW